MRVEEIDVPYLGPRDVMVEVAACGLCGHDIAVMQGLLRRGVKRSVILGHEIAGHVASIGDQVETVRPGDSVVSTLTTSCGHCQRCMEGREYRCLRGQGIGHALDGGFAQYVRLPETSVVSVPKGIEPADACLLACPMGAALNAVRDVAAVQRDESVLVTGAGGGLGVHCVLIAASLGARVLAVTTSPEKSGPLEKLAQCEVILAGELDFSDIAMAMTEDKGVDVVIDTIGSSVFGSSVRSLAQFGRVVLLGEVTGGDAQISLAEVLFRDATIKASTGASSGHMHEVAQMVKAGQLSPVVARTFALDEAMEAYRLMRTRQSFGRVVLLPR